MPAILKGNKNKNTDTPKTISEARTGTAYTYSNSNYCTHASMKNIIKLCSQYGVMHVSIRNLT